jgi:hypothetical protein
LKQAKANSSPGLYFEKTFTKIGLVEWLKVKALSSSLSAAKKKKKKKMAGEVHLCLEPSVSQGRILEGGWQRKVSLTHNMGCF